MIVNFEYDPNRSANLAKLISINSKKKKGKKNFFKYVLAVKGMKIFDKLKTINEVQPNISLKLGDTSILANFEPGDFLNSVEITPEKGAILARSAGTFCQVLQSSSSNLIKLRLPSKEQRLFLPNVKATLGIIANEEHKQKNLQKAGRNR